MPTKTAPYHRNEDFLTTVAELRQGGLKWHEVCARLRISRDTYYRCVRAIEGRTASATRGRDE